MIGDVVRLSELNHLDRKDKMDEKYESIQSILEEAGLYHQEKTELSGISGKNILLDDHFLADTNHDDIVDKSDIFVTTDGKVIEVSEVDATNGLVILTKDVKPEQIISLKYCHTSVDQKFVEKVREESIAEVGAKAGCVSIFEEKYKPIVRYIIRLLSAGKLLIRDYGFNEGVDGTSKDGYKKIELAMQKLNDLIKAICEREISSQASRFDSRDDGDLFPKNENRISQKEW